MVPIRCIISIDVVLDTTGVDPLLEVRDIDVMFMENASIQSAGESPMLTCTAVVAVGVGVGVGVVVPELLPLPQPATKPMAEMPRIKVETAVNFNNRACNANVVIVTSVRTRHDHDRAANRENG